MVLHMHDPAKYKYVSLSLSPCLMFFKLKITSILKSGGWELEKSELPWEQNFIATSVFSCRTISLPTTYILIIKLNKSFSLIVTVFS